MKTRKIILILNILIAGLLSISTVWADDEPEPLSKDLEEGSYPTSDWGLSFGLGVENFSTPYVQSASIRGEDRIVVVDEELDTLISGWLTMSWNVGNLITPYRKTTDGMARRIMWGPYAGVKVFDSNSNTFNGFSLGLQTTFITGDRNISLGLGAVNHKTRSLADGITKGEALPAHFDDIAFEQKSEWNWMLMLSVGL